MLKHINLITLLVVTALVFSSCKKEDPDIPNEEEVITTLNYTLTPAGGGSAITLSFVDLDGDGGNAPTITGGTLAKNETYTGSMELLNETETPAEDVTIEIAEEDAEHQFFFQSDISNLNVAYNDTDANGNPVGLSSTLSTDSVVASGTLTVILRHEPNKSAAGVSGGDITNAGGETDIEVLFPINVQ